MKKIALIRDGINHPSKDSTLKILKENFPDHEIVVINVLEIIKKKKFLILINLFFIFKEYFRHYLFGRKKFLFYFMRTTYMFKQVKRIINEIVNKSDFDFTFQVMLMFDGSTPGVPHFVYTDIVHLYYFDLPVFNFWHQNTKEWIELEKSIYQNATLNFTWSTNMARIMIKRYGVPEEKVICTYAGGNVVPRNRKVLDDKRYSNKNILFVGKDWYRKGGRQLIEAFHIVLETIPDATLTIVGCNPQISVPNCEIVPEVSVKEVGKYYEKASVFCLPTLIEPFGNVFVEALTYKLPIVALTIGAANDLVIDGYNGYKAEPFNIKQLASYLIELLKDPGNCKTFGENGYAFTLDRFSWDKVGKRIKGYIQSALNGNSPDDRKVAVNQ